MKDFLEALATDHDLVVKVQIVVLSTVANITVTINNHELFGGSSQIPELSVVYNEKLQPDTPLNIDLYADQELGFQLQQIQVCGLEIFPKFQHLLQSKQEAHWYIGSGNLPFFRWYHEHADLNRYYD